MSNRSEEKKPSKYFILGKDDKIVMLINKQTPNAFRIRELAWRNGLYNLNTIKRPLTTKLINNSKITHNMVILEI